MSIRSGDLNQVIFRIHHAKSGTIQMRGCRYFLGTQWSMVSSIWSLHMPRLLQLRPNSDPSPGDSDLQNFTTLTLRLHSSSKFPQQNHSFVLECTNKENISIFSTLAIDLKCATSWPIYSEVSLAGCLPLSHGRTLTLLVNRNFLNDIRSPVLPSPMTQLVQQ
jgi:hypothetical protein